MRFFALTVPGLGALLRDELAGLPGVERPGPVESDGRADVVPFAAPAAPGIAPRLGEDVFVEIGVVDGEPALGRLVERLWSPERYDAALPALPRLGARPGVRVVARLRSERRFLRTELRDALTREVLRARPRWRPADPARIELWALQTRPDRVRLGVRLSDRRMRQRSGRTVELPGALRPAVAAAMVRIACTPSRPPPPLIDPCCGSGTIVREALERGCAAIGADRSPEAVAAARANLPPRTPLLVADVTALPLRAAAAGAAVCNPPFGRRHPLDGEPAEWLGRAFAELCRVVRPGGPIVLLLPPSPAFDRAVLRGHAGLLRARHPVRLLGLPTTIWHLASPGPR